MVKLTNRLEKDKLMCLLCPNFCILKKNGYGKCLVRKSDGIEIKLEAYGKISSIAVEPIEKKPLTTFLPGSKTLSIGGYGCSLFCEWCENNSITQFVPSITKFYSCEKIVDMAIEHQCESVCMTYNEPSIYYEYLMELAEWVHSRDLSFVLKTNGYVNKEVWREICQVVDAANIDWKGGVNHYRHKMGARSTLDIEGRIREAHQARVHVEISIPVHDYMVDDIHEVDSFGQFLSSVNSDIPCHLLKINPAHRYISHSTTSGNSILKVKNVLRQYLNNVS